MTNEHAVTAGRLQAMYTKGALRYLRLGGVEVVRHIYMALRDRDWNTIPATLTNERVQSDGGSFTVQFDAEHKSGDIAFHWRGLIRGSHDRIEFEMDGVSDSVFLKNRVGLCVLHPTRECAGRPCSVEHSDGSTTVDLFPDQVSPQQAFLNVRTMTHEVAPGIRARVAFEGDVFETEDQRNWTDDSYKTYSTPLVIPFPARMEAGERVRHKVTVELLQDRVPVPRLGLGWSGQSPGPLRPDHLRVDVRLYQAGWEKAIESASETGLPLELAIHVTDPRQLELVRADAVRYIVYDAGRPATSSETARVAAELWGGRAGGGSNANFAELNRNREGTGSAGFLSFSANAQVHGVDDRTMMETIGGQAAAVRSARAIGGGKPVVVSPVTLKPRFNAVATSGSLEETPADPRQQTEFAAAWTLASIASLAAAGAESVTYFETVGPRGLAGAGGETFPVYRALEAIIAFQADGCLPCEVPKPLEEAVLVLTRGNARRTLCAKLTPPYGVTWRDE